MATLHPYRDAPEVIAVAAGKYIFRIGEGARLMYLIIECELDPMPGGTAVETATEAAFIGALPKVSKKARFPGAMNVRQVKAMKANSTWDLTWLRVRG